ncbi:MAG: hypothetical protein HY909_25395 [Deltaproteobacteria bacterium]|nr:hypothetical protein [Deltaproteobacteria bacterium]
MAPHPAPSRPWRSVPRALGLLGLLGGCGNTPIHLGTDDPAEDTTVPARWSWRDWRPTAHPAPVPARAALPVGDPLAVDALRAPRCRWVPSVGRVLAARNATPEVRSLQRVRDSLVLTYTTATENGAPALYHQRLSGSLGPRGLPALALAWPDDPSGDVVVSTAGLGDHHATLVSTRAQGCWFLPWQADGAPAGPARLLGARSCLGLRATDEGFTYFSSPEQGNPGDVWLVHLRGDGEDGRGHAVLPPVAPVMQGRSLRPVRVDPDRFVLGWGVPPPAGGIAVALVDSTGSVVSGPDTFPLPESALGGVQVAAHAQGLVALWTTQNPVTGLVALRALALGPRGRPALEASSWTPVPAEGVRFAWAPSLGEPVLAWVTREPGQRQGLLQVAPVEASGRPRTAPLVLSRCADLREVAVASAADGAVVVVYTDLCKTAPVPALVAVPLACQ